jgi:hypothetical protein
VVIALVASLLPVTLPPAQAAPGDTDSYFNLESATTSSFKYAVAADDDAFTISNAFTMQAWVYPTNSCTTTNCVILTKENEYIMAINNGLYLYALMGSTGWNWITTTVPANLNSWQHVAITRAANTNSITFYLNGVAMYTGTAGTVTTGTFNNSTFNFSIGVRCGGNVGVNGAPAEQFIGRIDEVKVWSIARTQSEVQSDMHTYGPLNNSNLRLYYDFNDVSGSTMTNLASGAVSATTLTLKNSPTFTALDTSSTINGVRTVVIPRTYLSANGWIKPAGVTTIRALAVGGGGGGGAAFDNAGAGGGGGAQVIEQVIDVSNTNSLNLTVGAYGPGGFGSGSAPRETVGSNGGESFIASGPAGNQTKLISALGGNGGDASRTAAAGNTGGSSSGGSAATSLRGALGGIGGGGGAGGGGGGGSSGAGSSGGSGSASGGAGGAGTSNSISGSAVTYGAGGAGGTNTAADGVDATPGRGNGGQGAASASSSQRSGGDGSFGILILTLTSLSGSTNAVSGAVFRQSTSITANLSEAGRVVFYERGKVIANCKSVTTVGSGPYTATCTWRPSTRGAVAVTAKFIPSSLPSSSLWLNFGSIAVGSRTQRR